MSHILILAFILDKRSTLILGNVVAICSVFIEEIHALDVLAGTLNGEGV